MFALSILFLRSVLLAAIPISRRKNVRGLLYWPLQETSHRYGDLWSYPVQLRYVFNTEVGKMLHVCMLLLF